MPEMPSQPYDLLVVGGGINGAGIARDAAGRGLSVLLCEKDDLACGTSSASSKLIHGGLRYLEYYEFRLVREALIEREVLLQAAPHIIWPLSFILPHDSDQRPAWLIRLGLFLYDHLGGRKRLPASRSVNLRRDPVGEPLAEQFQRGFSYPDCWVQDARLVVLNALDAQEHGADVRVGTALVRAERGDDLWRAELEDQTTGERTQVQARALVNAAGPWVADVIDSIGGIKRKSALRLVKGSHIVVPQLYDGPQVYIFQNDDKRVIFVIPYEDRYSLIGTTDIPVEGDPAHLEISESETDYLCRAVNRYLAKPVSPSDVVWSYAGVRPLYDDAHADASAVTRDYVFDIDKDEGKPPVLSVFGGKLTTYRKLAEHALEQLLPLIDEQRPAWTRGAVLPGGDLPNGDLATFQEELSAEFPWLPRPLVRRFARTYGTRARALLDDARSLDDLGANLGEGIYEAELIYQWQSEWARDTEDFLWRRTKLGLHTTAETKSAIDRWFTAKRVGLKTRQAAQ